MAILTSGGMSASAKTFTDVAQDDAAFVLYFFSPELGSSSIHRDLKEQIGSVPSIGCSMIGGWGPTGPHEDGVVLMSLGSQEVKSVHVAAASGTKTDPVAAADSIVRQLRSSLALEDLSPARHVGIVLVDGLSLGEKVIRRLSETIPIPLVGGAAADKLAFEETYVAANGTAYSDGVTVAVLEMRIPFYYGHYVHYKPTNRDFVVTDADPDTRTIWEIEGEPAARYYARLLGLGSADEISVDHFSTNPFGVVIGDQIYVRSPNAVVDGRGLRLYCYIEAGTRLQLLSQGDIIENAQEALRDAESHLGRIEGAALFNCVLRYLEMKATPGLLERFGKVFGSAPVVGVNTYGEELFTHHNQTLTALFFGSTEQ